MVARLGQGWVLAPCLGLLMDEVDALWPSRETASDGSIGDSRHQAEGYSDHNPRPGGDGNWYVSAVDITTADWSDALADLLIHDRRVKYVIWNRRYYQRIAWSSTDPVGEWVPYNGSDPHTGHIHVSVLMPWVTDTTAWDLPEVDMPLTDDDVARIAAVVVPAVWTQVAKGLVDTTHEYLPLHLRRLTALEGRVTGMQVALGQLAVGHPDPDALRAAMEDAMKTVLGSLDNEGTTNG